MNRVSLAVLGLLLVPFSTIAQVVEIGPGGVSVGDHSHRDVGDHHRVPAHEDTMLLSYMKIAMSPSITTVTTPSSFGRA